MRFLFQISFIVSLTSLPIMAVSGQGDAGQCSAVFIAQAPPKETIAYNLTRRLRTQIIKGGSGSGFVASRGLSAYFEYFPKLFMNRIENLLKEGGRILDSGCGEANALKGIKKLDTHGRVKAVGVTYSMSPETKAQETEGLIFFANQRYFEKIGNEELGKFDLIIDLFGTYSYSKEPLLVIEKYMQLLNEGGEIFINLGPYSKQNIYTESTELGRTEIPLSDFILKELQPLVEMGVLTVEVINSSKEIQGRRHGRFYKNLYIRLNSQNVAVNDFRFRELNLTEVDTTDNPPSKSFSIR